MIVLRVLPATQPALYAPWAIRETDLEQDAVREIVEAIKCGGTLPRTAVANQLLLEESTT